MNYRNPKVVITVRVLLGLFLIFSGISGLMAGTDMTGVPAPMVPYTKAFYEAGIFHMIKITEIVTGLMFVTGFLPALAAVMFAPLCVGIIVFNSSVAPEFLPAGVIVTVMNIYLGYAYFDKYRPMFARK